jgi:signal transduction histidine kinase
LGLLAALECHFKRYEAQTRISVHFDPPDLPCRLTADVETALYRIVQEALTNVARHAGVREVWIKLAVEASLIALAIEDRGCGFDTTASPAKTASTGLSGMRERATLLNGLFEIESAPGCGTRLRTWLPLRWAQEKP